MRLTFSRRALAPCAGLAASAILGTALTTVPSTANAATFSRHVTTETAGFTDADGVAWEARTGFDGGTYYRPGTMDIAGTTNDKLYQSEYWGITGWHTAVPAAGAYDVTLHLREAWFTKPGERVFDVTAEGKPAVSGIDVVKAVGARTAYDKTFRVTVSDGRLDLGFKASVDDAMVSAISVAAVPTAPAPTATPTTDTTAGLTAAVKSVGSSATLTWKSATSPAKGWSVGRDGTDTNGHGAWGTSVAGATRSQTFTNLVPGRTYTLTVTNGDTGEKVSKKVTVKSASTFTPSPTPTTGAPSAPKPTPTPSAPKPTTSAPAPTGTGSKTAQLFGTPRSGKPWFSGAWRGAPFTPASVDAIGTWRGAPMDAVTAYSPRQTLRRPSDMSREGTNDPSWNIGTYDGFGGIMNYNLGMIPDDRSIDFAGIARGDADDVWRANAQTLKDHGRGNSLVNIGWEMNGDWWAWSATAGSAEGYKAAFNRIASVMRSVAPNLKFGFVINCNTALAGASDRLDSLTKLYPGDTYTDVVGCNSYDWFGEKARTESEWNARLRPDDSPGLTDVADFARQHGKGVVISEWGPAATSVEGSGDNPFFIQKMYDWFMANRDVVVMENYFMESEPNVANSLINPVQMPQAAAKYASLW